VERAHRELRTRLADGLGRDDADRESLFDELPGRHIGPVAAGADALPALARQRAADADAVEAEAAVFGLGFEPPRDLLRDELVLANDDLVGARIADGIPRDAADDQLDSFTSTSSPL
jgi:hypothetical protein